DRDLHRLSHDTIRRVTEDVVERLHFNTAIAAVMELVTATAQAGETAHPATLREAVDTILLLLAPFVPHITSELWEASGHADRLVDATWPRADRAALVRATVELPVQINGKVRSRLTLPVDASTEDALATALADPRVQAQLAGRAGRKHVFVPGRMLSLVV